MRSVVPRSKVSRRPSRVEYDDQGDNNIMDDERVRGRSVCISTDCTGRCNVCPELLVLRFDIRPFILFYFKPHIIEKRSIQY
jgi:hypothetical protein